MNITLTGSLGHISRPLAETLIRKGHRVTIISSSPERRPAIEALGAKAAIGTMQDVGFLAEAFRGADSVYLMESLGEGFFFNRKLDYMEAVAGIAANYKNAVEQAGVMRVVHLSSIGAHTGRGNGMLAFHHAAENILAQLPDRVSIKTMRPVGFYYNMLAYIPTIKAQGLIIQNYGGDEKEPWVAPEDIAETITQEMETPFNGRTVRYIASDEVSPNGIAQALGQAIGKPDLKWLTVSDGQMLDGMLAAGMNPSIAKGVVDMNAGRRSGVLYEDYWRHRPPLCKTKLSDYAQRFADIYRS